MATLVRTQRLPPGKTQVTGLRAAARLGYRRLCGTTACVVSVGASAGQGLGRSSGVPEAAMGAAKFQGAHAPVNGFTVAGGAGHDHARWPT